MLSFMKIGTSLQSENEGSDKTTQESPVAVPSAQVMWFLVAVR